MSEQAKSFQPAEKVAGMRVATPRRKSNSPKESVAPSELSGAVASVSGPVAEIQITNYEKEKIKHVSSHPKANPATYAPPPSNPPANRRTHVINQPRKH